MAGRWQSYNANPDENRVGDCTVRAICTVLGQDWEKTYLGLCVMGLEMRDMPSSNAVWGAYLRGQGYRRGLIPDESAEAYTVRDFCRDHPQGRYIMAISGHVVAVIDGDYYDTWDSGGEIPVYYWRKDE